MQPKGALFYEADGKWDLKDEEGLAQAAAKKRMKRKKEKGRGGERREEERKQLERRQLERRQQ